VPLLYSHVTSTTFAQSSSANLLARLVFLLLMRRAPTSTLFPYTTLFRSSCAARSPPCRRCAPRSWRWMRRSSSSCALACTSTRTDRKSTRLNSSHSQISYAVFCLKKKNHDDIIKERGLLTESEPV